MPNISVIYYSATGSVHGLAVALAEGATGAGAEVRLRRAGELAPDSAIDANPRWRANAEATRDVAEATHDDLTWADGYAFGTPSRFGGVSAQLKAFLDSTGPLWAAGELADKTATAFASAQNAHGGNEATILGVYVTMAHWGTVIVPTGYTDEAFAAAGGNPYGTTHTSGDGNPPTPQALAAARRQGHRLAEITARLRPAR